MHQPSQLGQAQPAPSRGSHSSQVENAIEDPSHKWVINLSSKTSAPGSKVFAGQGTQLCSQTPPTRVHHCHSVSVYQPKPTGCGGT